MKMESNTTTKPMENKNQTAVEFLYNKLEAMIPRTILYSSDKKKYFEEALAIEKKQISQAYTIGVEEDVYSNPLRTGEMYYNETFEQ